MNFSSHDWAPVGLLTLLGFFFGSFANVCIYRWPRNLSINKPARSFCPRCRHPIAWFDNIPVLSFVFLKGRCRQCRTPIAWRYALVEIAMPALWLAAYFSLQNRFELNIY